MARRFDGRFSVGLGLAVLMLMSVGGTMVVQAQEEEPEYAVDPALFQAMEWRNIGPFRGGRATTVAGVAQDAVTYYMGATGGGVWKTTDAGTTWTNVTDGQFKTGSVGAIDGRALGPECGLRRHGRALRPRRRDLEWRRRLRSTDAGKTWKHLGLEDTRHISRIQVHPAESRSRLRGGTGQSLRAAPRTVASTVSNGGSTWEKVLSGDPKAGRAILSMDLTNPRVLYAAFWEHQRLPWKVVSGGPSSGVFKSDRWRRHLEEAREGPARADGQGGVDVSPANPERVWAMVEAEEGGLYRSDDGGESWQLVNSDRVLRARAWYYIHVFADPSGREHRLRTERAVHEVDRRRQELQPVRSHTATTTICGSTPTAS